MKKLIKEIIPNHALSIYNNLPICFIPSSQRKNLADNIRIKCYKNLDAKAFRWISQKKPLVICFINGFKPRGDDARPDRGLLPLARMLFGNDIDIMAIVFGQATFDMQDIFSTKPIQLAKRNGLWKSVLYYSSFTIADSANWTLTDAKLSQFQLHVTKLKELKTGQVTFPTPKNSPLKLKENDIDTSIHLTFTSNKMIFESLCNPPGGDWSGISFLDCNKKEHRWMSLPRVSDNAKRPDHIFQINYEETHYILIIESKERLSGLLNDKEELGQALIDYVTDLTKYQSSAILDNGKWKKNIDTDFILKINNYITAAAFFFSKDEEIEKAKKELAVDFIIGINTTDYKQYFYPNSELGKLALEILAIEN